MSELDSDLVHRGYWVNLSQGSFMGRTYTTDTKSGVILIAVLAVFTTLASSHIWNLFAFALHQIRADGRTSDGLYRQQQALLRTFPSTSTLLWESLKLVHLWKDTRHRGKKEKQALKQSIIHSIIAALFTAGFLAASVFSSQAINGTDIEVLVESSHCGLVRPRSSAREADGYTNKVVSSGIKYANECYSDNDTTPSSCRTFVHPRMPMTMKNETCPFDESICASHAVSVDSGLMDLNDAFGLNLQHRDRMKLRTKTSCSILSLENRTSIMKAADIPADIVYRTLLPQEEMMGFHLGSNLAVKDLGNVSFMYSLTQSNVTTSYDMSHYPWAPHMKSIIDLIPELKTDSADVWLQLIKKNNIMYQIPVDDPVFSAHRKIQFLDVGAAQNNTVYGSDTPASVLGCTSQVQFCINNSTNGEKCSALQAESDADLSREELASESSPIQQELLEIFETYATNDGLVSSNFVNLDAQSKVANSWVYSLPPDQWINEVKRWGAISLSMLQIRFADYAIGPSVRDSEVARIYKYPESESGKKLCGAQKMRKAGGFVNINVFALYFIIAISCTATLLDLVLLRFLIYMSRFRAALSPRIERWIQDGVFQLQRHAYEGEGQGLWENLDKEIPKTTGVAQLSDLPVRSSLSIGLMSGRTFTMNSGTSQTKNPGHTSVQQTVSRSLSTSTESLSTQHSPGS